MVLMAWRARRIQTQQKRKALQMLAISGVVRPSDVEMHYSTPLIKISGTHTTPDTQLSSNKQMTPPLSESSPQSPIHDPHRSQWMCHELPAVS
jgi:hypothetical protein